MRLRSKFLDLDYVNDSATGNGSTTVYSLSFTPQPATASALDVNLNGIRQRPTTDYTYNSGTNQITFVTAPVTAQSIDLFYLKKV